MEKKLCATSRSKTLRNFVVKGTTLPQSKIQVAINLVLQIKTLVVLLSYFLK